MPIIGSFGAGSAGGYGQRKGGLQPYDIDFLLVAGGGASIAITIDNHMYIWGDGEFGNFENP